VPLALGRAQNNADRFVDVALVTLQGNPAAGTDAEREGPATTQKIAIARRCSLLLPTTLVLLGGRPV